MKNTIIISVLVLILGIINYKIYEKEETLANGQTILLQLAPRDPRSLMQGDYMVLRYKIAQDLRRSNSIKESSSYLVLQVAEDKTASFERFYSEGEKLAKNEVFLKYRLRGSMLKLGAESFFFQEGHAKVYETARYGELKVEDSGESVLVGLRDEKLRVLGL